MVDTSRVKRLAAGGALVGIAIAAVPTVMRKKEAPQIPQALQAAEKPLSHLPDDYHDLFKLSDEQKTLFSALTASGADAVAYYTPDGDGNFSLNKHIDLYNKRNTRFEEHLAYDPRNGVEEVNTGGARVYHIPVKVGEHVKGVAVFHADTTHQANIEEAKECRDAKLRMATHIINTHADLFGISGQLLKRNEQAHLSFEKKHAFFMTLAKDMFKTFGANHAAPELLQKVDEAKTAKELMAALRKVELGSSEQYPHVLGVSELMGQALDKAVNAKGELINARQRDLIEVLTLLHDVGKTQTPSQQLAPENGKQSLAESELAISRNGSHPLFTLLTLLFYERDGMMTATHHNGLRRYGDEEIAVKKMKGTVGREFNDWTEFKGKDMQPAELSPLAKIMRVVDVTEAITARPSLPMSQAIKQLGAVGTAFNPDDLYNKARLDAAGQASLAKTGQVVLGRDGNAVINQDSMDPDYVCFLIANGVFDAYAKQRAEATGGWLSTNKDFAGQSRYDPERMKEEGDKVLHRFGWDDPKIRAEKEAKIRKEISEDRFLQENSPARAARLMGMQ